MAEAKKLEDELLELQEQFREQATIIRDIKGRYPDVTAIPSSPDGPAFAEADRKVSELAEKIQEKRAQISAREAELQAETESADEKLETAEGTLSKTKLKTGPRRFWMGVKKWGKIAGIAMLAGLCFLPMLAGPLLAALTGTASALLTALGPAVGLGLFMSVMFVNSKENKEKTAKAEEKVVKELNAATEAEGKAREASQKAHGNEETFRIKITDASKENDVIESIHAIDREPENTGNPSDSDAWRSVLKHTVLGSRDSGNRVAILRKVSENIGNISGRTTADLPTFESEIESMM